MNNLTFERITDGDLWKILVYTSKEGLISFTINNKTNTFSNIWTSFRISLKDKKSLKNLIISRMHSDIRSSHC